MNLTNIFEQIIVFGMLSITRLKFFRMSMGEMFVDYKMMSRDHKRVVRVEGARVDPTLERTIVPLSWLEGLRSPSRRLPSGFFAETSICASLDGDKILVNSAKDENPGLSADPYVFQLSKMRHPLMQHPVMRPHLPLRAQKVAANGVQAGPLVMYIEGQLNPVVLTVNFVPDEILKVSNAATIGYSPSSSDSECDLRIGKDAIEQCGLFVETRPGGLLSDISVNELTKYGMKTPKPSYSPLVARPWTKMKHMFIDEIQRGPKLTEFVGYNPRSGSPWRFSQHCKYFRMGIWRETIRKGDMHEGLHVHSSHQKSHQQAVPDVHFMAPSP